MTIKNENGRITKVGRAAMLARAKQLLVERGFKVDEPCGWLTLDDLIAEFGIQRRSAKVVEAQAARLLRGEFVAAWQRKGGLSEEPRRKRSVSLTDAEYERLQALGDSNATEGIRRLIALHAYLSPEKNED